MSRASTLIEAREYSKGLSAATDALAAKPEGFEANYLVALALFNLGLPQRALPYANTASKTATAEQQATLLAPLQEKLGAGATMEGLQRKAEDAYKREDYATALEKYRDLFRRDHRQREAGMAAMKAAYKAKLPWEAAPLLQQLLHPDDPSINIKDVGDIAEAYQRWFSDCFDACWKNGDDAFKRGDFQNAATWYFNGARIYYQADGQTTHNVHGILAECLRALLRRNNPADQESIKTVLQGFQQTHGGIADLCGSYPYDPPLPEFVVAYQQKWFRDAVAECLRGEEAEHIVAALQYECELRARLVGHWKLTGSSLSSAAYFNDRPYKCEGSLEIGENGLGFTVSGTYTYGISLASHNGGRKLTGKIDGYETETDLEAEKLPDKPSTEPTFHGEEASFVRQGSFHPPPPDNERRSYVLHNSSKYALLKGSFGDSSMSDAINYLKIGFTKDGKICLDDSTAHTSPIYLFFERTD